MINLWEKNIPTERTYKINNNLLDEKYTKNNILIKNNDPYDNYLEKNIEQKLMNNIISNIYNLQNNSDNFIKIINKDITNNYDIVNIKIKK